MCGISGLVDLRASLGRGELRERAARMAGALAHRGPDADGIWVDEAAGVALGHRRLSIIDLSPAGAQPMASACGRHVLVYNGELYNAPELRRELGPGVRLRGHSDTEVLLEGLAAWGVEPCLGRLAGMFAFALWDRERRELTLARDRLGIKPLYWARFGHLVLFGSELKALRAAPGWTPEVDRDALAAYLRHSYVPAPHGIYRGVRKLPPGHALTLPVGGDGEPRLRRYWDALEIAAAPPHRLDEAEAEEALAALLRDAVGRHMVADVPLGAFLSGGVDSSLVAALMQAQSGTPVRSFTIGFAEAGYDEAPHARAVAAHLGTDHTELEVRPAEALALVARLPETFDEPFGDSSQIPTCLLAALTRRHVTVALSGDGGDELFAGYRRYRQALGLWRRLDRLPGGLRRALAGGLRAAAGAAAAAANPALDRLGALAPAGWLGAWPAARLETLGATLAAPDVDALYRQRVSHWRSPEALVPGAREPRGVLWDASVAGRVPDFLSRMQLLDLLTYLPDDILTKVDRATMAASLEARVPLLDHRVVEFALRLPNRLKLRDGAGKWLLRRVLARFVPPALTERPKQGFAVPLGAWLRGPLRDWAEDLLDERRLRETGLLAPTPVRARWRDHLAGRGDWQGPLWDVLMFQAWLAHARPAPLPAGGERRPDPVTAPGAAAPALASLRPATSTRP